MVFYEAKMNEKYCFHRIHVHFRIHTTVASKLQSFTRLEEEQRVLENVIKNHFFTLRI